MKKQLFDNSSFLCSKIVTNTYSTSFSLAVKMLSPKIRSAIYGVYGFVRYADEIVDTFHDYPKEELLNEFEAEYYTAMERGISTNPIINAFQQVVKKYSIEDKLVRAFLKSMRMDLTKKEYLTDEEYREYIYGSADVVGLMCLRIFVNGDNQKYEQLKDTAMRLGSAFQKVNFLRDLKDDVETLNRFYFPGVDLMSLDARSKKAIIDEIELDFEVAFQGIKKLPVEAKFGVYTAFRYYRGLLLKLKRTKSEEIITSRIRISNPHKVFLLSRSFVKYKLNLI
ncbi:phytoene/squalene synthase family protein [Aureibacter tunicatorum]|uniref:Phytoene/squalene synthetase n=1 Tax=Aureibacter tunicatorum TaxID=866807 RepID=A0AAE3XMI1_9BACT|nr:phytoene/squalene synthase family protein [Aureibacter tunicatorum]MDR6239182.1 phytoene/squalene synthetase [Aureibacter tunicatorum]BDD04892.1 phytoene synthase [Aureibacter tunicatorum]